MQSHIRPATIEDSDDIADILADGWARAYAGFMPPHILAPRTNRMNRRRELRAFMSDEFEPANEALFVAVSDAKVLGFIHVVLGNKGDLGTGGYVSLLYTRDEASGRGIGRRLVVEGARWLGERTKGSIAIAAFKDNPFHGFYAQLGGALAKSSAVRIEDFECISLIYLWPSADALQQRAEHRVA